MFGLTNLDVATLIEGKMKEILKETKDYEHSYELKIAICSMLIIIKDRQPKQVDALMRFESLLKGLYDYIALVDVKYGGDKPVGGSLKKLYENE